MVDYSDVYDGYWQRPDRIGESSFDDPAPIARQILATCGPGSLLDVGSGMGTLVLELLKQGADAFGVDVSSVAAAHCNRYAPGRFFAGSILKLPFQDESFDALISTDCLEHLAPEDVPQALREMRRVCRRNLFLRIATGPDRDGHWHLTIENRGWWEDVAFATGFRKHPLYYTITPFHALEMEGNSITIPLEKITDNALTRYPLDTLLECRGLHMDMSRETGARSDAHMARYDLAAEWVRPGDAVLDCACGLGYGTAMLAATSRGKRFLGVDIEETAVTYARDNFGERYGVEYRQGNAEDLSILPDASVDTLISFETLEHVPHFERFLAEAGRILKPDGRIVVSVPNRWEDETGRDPNPYHHHVFDYAKTRMALESAEFTVEARYAQSAPGGFKLVDAPRTLKRLPLQTDGEKDTEWWILVASADPLDHTGIPYSHPYFDRSATGKNFHLTDFSGHYDNPWLYRSMVQMGERFGDPCALQNLARKVLTSASSSSADYGAALAVIGYQTLADPESAASEVDKLLKLSDVYLVLPDGNPHVLRWQISLAFLSALLALKKGDRQEALRYFAVAAETDPFAFSPLLATKTVAACFWSGVLHLADGNQGEARRSFAAGVEVGRRALHAPDENAIGNPLDPLTFGFPELAEVADMAGQCANALHSLDEFGRSPGKFWRAVDMRRFGLATWAMNLEAELKELRVALEKNREVIEKNREVIEKNREVIEKNREVIEKNREVIEKNREAIEALWHENSLWARVVNRTLEKLLGARLIRMRVLQRLRLNKE